jgi:hypothetical protein
MNRFHMPGKPTTRPGVRNPPIGHTDFYNSCSKIRGDYMANANKCYAYFYVEGSFNPAQITERVGINPTNSWLEGDVIERTKMPRKCSRWQLRSRLETTATLEQHVSDVLAQLDENRKAFKHLSAELGGAMVLVGLFNECNPGLTFERDVIERLAGYVSGLRLLLPVGRRQGFASVGGRWRINRGVQIDRIGVNAW